MVPKVVLMRSGLVSLTTARPVNTAQPRTTVNSSRPMTNRVNIVSGKNVNTARPKAVVNTAKSKAVLNDVKGNQDNPQMDLQDQGVIDSGCSRHMTGNMSYLTDLKKLMEDLLPLEVTPKEGKSQAEVPRKNNMYSVDLKNIVPKGGLTCLFAKATSDESKLWHRRLGHINFKTMNKLVKGNLVRGLPSKLFENDQTCVACQKGKKHRASCKSKIVSSISQPLHMLHMDLFGPPFVKSLMKKMYCLVVTDDYSRYPVTILNIIDHLGKFDGKADEGFFVGYSINSKAFRVFNNRTRIVEENMHVQFSKNTPNIAGSGPNWLFDIDVLTKLMNYKPVIAGNQYNGNAGTKACDDAGKARMETVPGKDYILLPLWSADLPFSQNSKNSLDVGFKPSGDNEKKVTEKPGKEGGDSSNDQEKEDDNVNSTNNVNTASDGNSTNNVNAVSSTITAVGIEVNVVDNDAEDVGAEADMNNLNTFMPVSPIPTTRIHKDHLVEQIIRDLNSAPQTRRMTKNLKEHGYTQEEGIDYDEVFVPVSRIEAIRLFLVYASFKEFMVYQMDVKSAFLYGKIEEEVYVCQPLGFEDPDFPDRVYKVEKALYGMHQAPRAWYETLSTYLLDNGFQRGKIDKTLFIKRDKGDILLVQVYVDDIIFGSTKKSLCTKFEKMMHKKFQMSSMGELIFFLRLTPMETQKHLLKDEDGEEVDVHLYRSMIGSLMYLTSSRSDIMFAVCQPKLGLLYLKDLPFDLVSYIDSDYAGASLDMKSTTGGIGVNVGDSKLMLLGKNLLLLGKVNVARHNLLLMVIVDFLNASSIKYALTVNPTIYTSCIEQFWSTVKAKTVNGEVQLQALVDGKKIVVTEAYVRRDLQLEDADGVDFLPNATIFKQLTLMGRPKEKDTQVPQSSIPSDLTNITDEAVNEEPSMQLKELMDFCTKLQQRVLDLKNTKTVQSQEITSLKKRVKKLEKKGGWKRISHKGQKQSQKQKNQARDGKDKVKSKPKSKSQQESQP
ncbi:putative ribonuclease H-like domain-containing protein [Tanacetum coccineum]